MYGAGDPIQRPELSWGAEKAHIKLLQNNFFPVAPVTSPSGQVSGQRDLCFLGSEDNT